jgi:uncharacterized membrane protein
LAGWWTLIRILHVLGASVWVGSLVAFTFFLRPAAERQLEADRAKELVDKSGRTLGFFIAGFLVPVQLFTGLALLLKRGFRLAGLGSESLYARIIVIKIVLFFVVVGISALHGALSARSPDGSSRILAWLALAGSLVLLGLGAALVP